MFIKILKSLYRIVVNEKLHVLWLVVIVFFGFINVWMHIFTKGLDSLLGVIESGDLYLTSTGVLAPSLFDLLALIYFEKVNKSEVHFLKIKICFIVVGFIVCFIVNFLASGVYKSNIQLQLFVVFAIVIYSFICYLTKFLSYPDNKDLDDTYYDDKKKEGEQIEECHDTQFTVGEMDVKI